MSLQPNSSSLHTGTCTTCPTCLTYPLSLQPVSSSEYHQCRYNPCTIEGCNTSETSGSHPPCSSRDWMDGILEVRQNVVLDLSLIKDPHEFGRFGRYLSRSGCRNVIGHTRFLHHLRHDCQKKRRILYHHLPWGLRLQKKNRTWPPIINIPKNRHLPLESQGSVHWCYPEHLPVLPPILGRGMMRDAMGKLHREMDQWSSSKWLLCPRMQKKKS